jgi:hypothetical protein
MPYYLVEVATSGREVYGIEAVDEADARARGVEDGACVVQETLSVEDITSVKLVED